MFYVIILQLIFYVCALSVLILSHIETDNNISKIKWFLEQEVLRMKTVRKISMNYICNYHIIGKLYGCIHAEIKR